MRPPKATFIVINGGFLPRRNGLIHAPVFAICIDVFLSSIRIQGGEFVRQFQETFAISNILFRQILDDDDSQRVWLRTKSFLWMYKVPDIRESNLRYLRRENAPIEGVRR
jgi:hypothetical protein